MHVAIEIGVLESAERGNIVLNNMNVEKKMQFRKIFHLFIYLFFPYYIRLLLHYFSLPQTIPSRPFTSNAKI